MLTRRVDQQRFSACPHRPPDGPGFAFQGRVLSFEPFALLLSPLKLGIDSLADHAALELGKGPVTEMSLLAGPVDRLLLDRSGAGR
jgi:hypothetical protein